MKTKPISRTKPVKLPKIGIQPEQQPLMTELYHRAQARLQKQRQDQRVAGVQKPAARPERLLHELQVHQVELEMQNAELQKTRDDLEASLENYTDLYDFAPAGYFTLSPDGTIQQVNLFGANLVGIERSRLLGQSFGRLVSAAHRPVFDAFLQRVFSGEDNRSIDIELLKKDQPPQVVRVRARRSAGGLECRAVVGDITELKREEDKVRVSEVRYRRLFEATHDGVLLLDPRTRKITEANPFMTRLLGYPHDQLVGKELFEIGLLKDEVASQEMFQKLKREHEVRYEDLPLESKGGRHQEVEVVANLYEENGRAVIQCNIRDITARKKTEQQLSEKARLLDLSHDAVIVRDTTGHIRYWNHGAEEIYGWSREEAMGKISNRLLHTKYPVSFQQMIEELHRTDRWIGELVHTKRNGQRITVLARKTLDRDRQGHPVAVLETITDITERKQAESAQRRLEVLGASNLKLRREIIQREAAQAALKQSEQQQRRLLAESRQMQDQLRQLSREVLRAQEEERKRISRELHDVIAQTLTGINVQLAALAKGAAINTKGLARNIARTQRLVEKSVDIVHEFARELRPAVLDDLGLIPALHSFLKLFSKRTRIHVHLKAFAGVEQLNSNHRTVFYRVAQEALTNVSRHAQASQVEVCIQKLPDGVCMKVIDDGKSFKVDSVLHGKEIKRLGLLGMRERLEMIGGHFQVESAPGKGTTIIAKIPLRKAGGGALTESVEINP